MEPDYSSGVITIVEPQLRGGELYKYQEGRRSEKTPDCEVECDHSTSEKLHDALWDVFDRYTSEKEIKKRIIVRAGPYDCPSGARVIIDMDKRDEVGGQRTEQDALNTLYAMVAELRKMGREYKESVTVKVTFLCKPSPPASKY